MHRHDGSGSGREISLRYYAGRVLWTALRWYFLITIAFVILYPLMYMVSMAFRSPQDFYDVTVVWIPKHLTLDNFRRVLFGMGLLRPLLNTAFTSVCATVLHILVVAATGYGFARYAFSGRGAMFVLAVSTIMIPAQMLNLPNYLVMKELDFFGIVRALTGHASPVNLLNSPLAVLVPAALGQGLMSGFFILVFRQFFANLPNELEEAATIDGCGHLRTYFSVMLPNAATALTICSIAHMVLDGLSRPVRVLHDLPHVGGGADEFRPVCRQGARRGRAQPLLRDADAAGRLHRGAAAAADRVFGQSALVRARCGAQWHRRLTDPDGRREKR